MAKTYKILVNDGKGTDIKPVSVVQGASAKGEPIRMTAKRGWRFELQDDLKGKNLGPDQVRLKRMGKNLGLMFDGSVNPDVIIEDFYAENEDKEKDNGSPMIVGQAEDGGIYEYVPQDPAASSMASQLKDGNTPVIVALGGGPLAADFALAGLPLIAAAGGGIGGLLAGGAAVVAAAAAGGGGGGGGGDTPAVVVAPTGQTGRLQEGATNDTGLSSTDSITMNQNPVYRGVAEKGAAVEVTVNGVTYKTTASATDGTFSVQLTNNGQVLADGIYTPTIKATNSAGSTTVNGTAFTVDHKTDKNQDATKSPIEVDDRNNSSSTIEITTINDGLTNTTSATGSKDTGRFENDFVTSDGTLNFNGKVTNFDSNGDVVHVQVFKADGTLVLDQYVTPGSNGNWTIDNKANTLADGTYTIKARVEDRAGNVVQTAEDKPLTIDSDQQKNQPNGTDDANKNATISLSTIDDGLSTTSTNGSKDTGLSNSDFITSDSTLTFRGTVGNFNANGDLVHLQVFKSDGVTLVVDEYLTPSQGAWTFTPSSALVDGKYIIKARIEDVAGNTVKSINDQELIVDTKIDKNQPNDANDSNTGAAIAIGGIDDGDSTKFATTGSKDTGSSNSDLITSDGTLSFSGTVTNFTSNGDKVHLRVFKADGTTLVVDQYLTPDAQGKWTYNNQSNEALADGKYIIKASIEDKAGNVLIEAAAKDLIIDKTKEKKQPEGTDDENNGSTVSIAIVGIDDGDSTKPATDGSKDTGSSNSDLITSDGTLSFNGTVTNFTANGDKVHLRVFKADGTTLVVDQYLTPDAQGKWTFNNQSNEALADGKYIIKAVIEDTAGNPVKEAVSKDLIIDKDKAKRQPEGTDDENNVQSVSVAIVGIDDGRNQINTDGSNDTGTSKTDMVTSDKTLSFNGTVANYTSNGDLVHLKVEKVVNGVTTVVLDKFVEPSSNGVWLINNQSADIAAGTYTVKATLEDKAGNVIKTAADKTLVIEGVVQPTSFVLGISSISDDSGSNNADFVTSDNKLTVNGSTNLPANTSANIFVQILSGTNVVRSGYATLTNPSAANSGWTFVADTNGGTSTLDDGRYTISAVYTTQAGTEISVPKTQILNIANSTPVLIANEDKATVTEGNSNSVTGKNVLTNDGDSAPGASIHVGKVEKGSSITNTTSTKAVSGSTATSLKGEFGQLDLFADGHYVYTPDGSLTAGVTRQDVFTYEVSTDGTTRTATTTLKIDVTGVDDKATLGIKVGNESVSSVLEVPTTAGGHDSANNVFLTIQDADATQNVLKLNFVSGVIPPFAGEFGTLTLADESAGKYSWQYDKLDTTVHLDGVVQHDLFTFESSDGSAKTTLDFQIREKQDTTVTKHIAHGKTSSIDTLTFGTIQQLVLDFTAAGQNIALEAESVEVIDITGGGSTTAQNTIKLDLSSLTQADTFDGSHFRLFIKGDSNDKVVFNLDNNPDAIDHEANAMNVGGTDYWVYKIGNDELLVQTAIAQITVNG